jgi:putative transposase
MRHHKCSLDMYVRFLQANQNNYSGLELSKVSPVSMTHDCVSRWLSAQEYTPSNLWQCAQPLVDITTGYLVCDDSVLDKRYSRKNELTHSHYSGNVHGLVTGIDMVNLLWSDGSSYIPVDYRIYDKPSDTKTKNDHFLDMLEKAKKRNFTPAYVLMDSWYSSTNNLKYIRDQDWKFITNLKSNRLVSEQKGIHISISDLDFTETPVKQVWLKDYGYILICVRIIKNGDRTYLATNDLSLMNYDTFMQHHEMRWKIEEYHRGLKQTTGVEGCYSTKAVSQKTHIFASVITFLKLEKERIRTGISWYEQKATITRSATVAYLV